MEDNPEPPPDDADLRCAFDNIAELTDWLQSVRGDERSEPGIHAGLEAS